MILIIFNEITKNEGASNYPTCAEVPPFLGFARMALLLFFFPIFGYYQNIKKEFQWGEYLPKNVRQCNSESLLKFIEKKNHNNHFVSNIDTSYEFKFPPGIGQVFWRTLPSIKTIFVTKIRQLDQFHLAALCIYKCCSLSIKWKFTNV